MYLVLLGVIMILMKSLALDPVAALDWWWVLSPFAFALVWWAGSDLTGYTHRRLARAEAARKQARIAMNRKQAGLQKKATKR